MTSRAWTQRSARLAAVGVATAALALLAGCGVAAERLDASRLMAQELAAVQTLKTIQTAQVQYYSQFNMYARTLSQLGPAPNGPASAANADLLPADLVAGTKGGYHYVLTSDGKKYSIEARPEVWGTSGKRSFYSDDSMVIHQNRENAPATADSPAVGE